MTTLDGQPSAASAWADKYRGATVEDLDPPQALSTNPHEPIAHALMVAFERDYTHLTVVSSENRALLGYLSIPRLKQMLKEGKVTESDNVKNAMLKFRRGKVYKVITMDTPLEELEAFFEGGEDGLGKQDFAVVTDYTRRFVLGVATRADLEEFVKRRPA
ncbi:hypothetical protein BT63DRAFT_7997 [Microthyrium microscopicum]|uniref:Cystathionine beta-synthase n=1 Tax=Microthyrium microscopicum TaxID=703497 RepID=A0A6A6UPZ9_9PEZI|nr:hypothetical protein BT63DRAFT_7997 [Microthyrium microscopicum]